jgi:hypothetical protein
LAILRGLNEAHIKVWWIKFSASEKYNAARQNWYTMVFIALAKGGALNFVENPGHWWWDPDIALAFTRALKTAITTKKRGAIQFAAPDAVLQRARVSADANAHKHGIRAAL